MAKDPLTDTSFRTDLAAKLDAQGEILICDGINIGLRIQNLADGERLQLLPFLARELAKDFGKDFTIKQLVTISNLLMTKEGDYFPRQPPKLPVLATGKLKTQTIENTGTGQVTQVPLIVELKDIAKMGEVGVKVHIQNLTKDEKIGLIKLIGRDIILEERKKREGKAANGDD